MTIGEDVTLTIEGETEGFTFIKSVLVGDVSSNPIEIQAGGYHTMNVTLSGSEITPKAAPEPLPMYFAKGEYYGDDWFNGTHAIPFGIADFNFWDTSLVKDGRIIWLDLVAGNVNAATTKEFIDIPAGTYTVISTFDPPAGSIVMGSFTSYRQYVNGELPTGNDIRINGGTVTISGDNTGYTMLVDVTLAGGGTLLAEYNGPMVIRNPRYVPPTEDVNVGTLSTIYDLTHTSDAMGDGSIDGYNLIAWDSGVYEDGGNYRGSGWIIQTQLHAAINSGPILPDGTYNITGSSLNPGTALFGYSSPAGPAGTWVFRLENGAFADQRALKSGTLTSTYANGQYTIVINGVDASGSQVTGTVEGAVSPAPAARHGLWKPFSGSTDIPVGKDTTHSGRMR
jgi:hypothetical protein